MAMSNQEARQTLEGVGAADLRRRIDAARATRPARGAPGAARTPRRAASASSPARTKLKAQKIVCIAAWRDAPRDARRQP